MELRGRAVPEPWRIPPFVRRSRLRQVCSIQMCRSSSEQRNQLGANEQPAASMGHPDRISECREAVRSGGGAEAFFAAVLARAVAGLDLGTQGASHGWIIRNCTSFRFLRGVFIEVVRGSR